MGFAEEFITGVQAGQQQKRQQQAQADDAEDRKVRLAVLKHAQEREKLEDLLTQYRLKREAAGQQFEALQGTPEAQLSPAMMAGGALPGMPFPGTSAPPGANQMAPVEFPGLPAEVGGGTPSYQRTPQTLEQQLQQQARTRLTPPQNLINVPQGGAVFDPNTRESVFTNPRPEAAPPRPQTVSLEQQALAALQAGDTQTFDQIQRVLNLRDVNMGGGGAGKGSEQTNRRRRLVKAVLDNPELYDKLTPSDVGDIAPDLAEAGFAGFGRRLSDGAITKMSESRSAIASVKDLREILKANEQFIGPLAGLQALNPYSKGRQAQADINRVKQRVGKALEGGVLRKEDEEKYKKILATLTDTPETAIYKTDQMIEDLERDLSIFIEEQRAAGRRVTSPTTTPKPTGRFNPATGRVEAIP